MSNANDFVIENGVLKKYKGSGGNVIVPEGVTSIGSKAFWGCENLQSITLPEGVTNIGDSAFSFCSSLQSITLPEGVTSIGKSAFEYCSSLQSITLPEGVTSIGYEAFYGCKSLKSITLPEGVTRIGDKAFYDCKNLQSITLPEGVTRIGDYAFYRCSSLQSITLPVGVTSIGNGAFSDCESLQSITPPESVTSIGDSAFSGCKSLQSITLPEGVTSIESWAFYKCENLQSITLPEGVTSIGSYAFIGCENLKKLEMNNCKAKLTRDVFGNSLPEGLIAQVPELYPYMADGALKQYVLTKKVWQKLDHAVQTEIFITRQSKALTTAYLDCIGKEQLEPLGNAVIERLNSAKPSAKDCNAAAAYMTMFQDKASVTILNQLYARLKECKNSAKAIKTVESHVALMEKLGNEMTVDESLSSVSRKVMTLLIADKKNEKDVEKALKDYYGLTFNNLLEIKDAEGKNIEPYVMAWLLMAHETMESYQRTTEVYAGYEKSGLCPEAAEIVAMLDQKSLQAALLQLADEHLGAKRLSKKVFLAFPVCRYADEDLMEELTKRAPKWRSSISGDDALPLDPFREAVWYSDTRAAMFFAERYNDLKEYAYVRGMDEDTIRDKYLSDVGLDEKGGKEYDLGNQVVTARLQDDMSFLVELPSGKNAKSLPKKGADPEKYEAAKKDFDAMKKNAKRILKNRGKVLFEDFLSGKKRSAEDWQGSYLRNPILREAASLVVWAQGKKTFTLKDGAPVNNAEQPYTITDKPIRVAHPMEMKEADIKAWQKYFTFHGLKQPFAQVWEPVRKAEEIKEDRYKDCMIPYYRFLNQEKHGITVEDNDFHNEIYINLAECDTDIERIDWNRHEINPDDRFEVQTFKFKKYSRQVNHIVAYLDRVTVWDRVRKDDLSVMETTPSPTSTRWTSSRWSGNIITKRSSYEVYPSVRPSHRQTRQ